MYAIKNGKVKSITGIYAVKDKTVRSIQNVYSVIKGKAVLVWTAIKDFIASVFAQGYWQNQEGWNNDDAWKNEP